MTKVKAKLKTKTELKPKKPLAKAVEKVRVRPLSKGDLQKYYDVDGMFHTAKRDFLVYKVAHAEDPTGQVDIAIISLIIKKGTRFFVGCEYTDYKNKKGVDEQHPKCRAAKATVMTVKDIDSGKKLEEAYSSQDSRFKYQAGKEVAPKGGFSTSHRTCDRGIHFFMTREAAISYRDDI